MDGGFNDGSTYNTGAQATPYPANADGGYSQQPVKGDFSKGDGKKGGGKKGKGKGKNFAFRKGISKGGGKADMYYGNSEEGDRVRPALTEAEAKEARAIVVKAQLAHAEREANKKSQAAAVAAASPDDLQAMINARLKK
uniref:Uncharacterized protein n=1 Tax=Karlodinium veneficum TaxID=407301 RepID=A7WPZ1_KARVE|nr:unknown [Karlodinium veneficum]|mmetsp:Transcript_77196/g.121911  ORF Transcript_77196/g.121911 Transcript_77196/m.121911 type:complete len:139 (-) Transcript_77196:128-544(-)|eukprot:CAMPEP_0169104938 /NCGR_PEP_ID=MMETSP1015-20121227/23527_1 /TAXON_ID=342587 /ORGANISM="Karlodinium micrum, Strain CCMP2283" /LENGTH=138 /DNA_ID=CAMNT_0009166259 /DNA_START=109 /DNA_END=525 /DNA_ORIENTATION=+